MTLVVHAEARIALDGVADVAQALAWLDGADLPDVTATSLGHQQLVVTVVGPLEPGSEHAFTEAHGTWPLLGRWSPRPWPARACGQPDTDGTTRPPVPIGPTRLHAVTAHPAKGGFRPIERLLGLLVDVRCEAHAAKLVLSKRERDAAFDEIAELADQAMQLVERYAKPAPTAQLREVAARAR